MDYKKISALSLCQLTKFNTSTKKKKKMHNLSAILLGKVFI